MKFRDIILRLIRGEKSTIAGPRPQRPTLGDRVRSLLSSNVESASRLGFAGRYEIECFDATGRLKWRDVIDNLVVDTGLNDALDKWLKGSTYTAAFYVGLVSSTPTIAAGDTMSSHAGWTDNATYSNATRPALTLGTVASKSVDNSASKAVFNINGTATIGGAFVTTSNTKSGTTGTLISAGAFSGGNKSVSSGDTLNVQITYTGSSS